jgi:hypothetical protein
MSLPDEWIKTYNELYEFIEKNERMPYIYGGLTENRLAQWLLEQKKLNAAGVLDEEKITKLRNIPGGMTMAARVDRWFQNYHLVKKFISDHKRLPSQYSKNVEEYRLGRWRTLQKKVHKTLVSPYTPLTDIQTRFLESLPGWEWQYIHLDKWHERYNELVNFVNTYHRLPKKRTRGEKSLYEWCYRQRFKLHDSKYGTLTPEQIWSLEQIKCWKWKDKPAAKASSPPQSDPDDEWKRFLSDFCDDEQHRSEDEQRHSEDEPNAKRLRTS